MTEKDLQTVEKHLTSEDASPSQPSSYDASSAPTSAALSKTNGGMKQHSIVGMWKMVTKEQLVEAFANLAIEGELPFRLCESPALRRFVGSITRQQNLDFPCRNTVMRLVDKKYADYCSQLASALRQDLRPVEGICGKVAVTMDGWTDDNMASFCVVTFHWASEGHRRLARATAACEPFPTPHDTPHLRKLLQQVAVRFQLAASPDAKIETWCAGLTTDTASNVLKIAQDAGAPWLRIKCFCHVAQLCITTVLKSCPAFAEIVELVRSVMNLFAHSTKRRDDYARVWHREREGQRLLRPIFPNTTRWNTVFFMLLRYCEMWGVLDKMTWAELGYESAAARNAVWNKLEKLNPILPHILRVLEPFYVWTERLSAALKVTASLVPQAARALQAAAAPGQDAHTDADVIQVVAALRKEVDTRFGEVFDGSCRPILLAQFLDPRTAHELNVLGNDGKLTSDAVDKLDSIRLALKDDLTGPDEAQPAADPDDDLNWDSGSDNGAADSASLRWGRLKLEFKAYLASVRRPGDALPLVKCPLADYWMLPAIQEQYPLLTRLAFHYLCQQASEADSERSASLAGRTLTATRRKMAAARASRAVVLSAAFGDGKSKPVRLPGVRHKAENAIAMLKGHQPPPPPPPAPGVIVVDEPEPDEVDEGDIDDALADLGVALVKAADGGLCMDYEAAAKIFDPILEDQEVEPEEEPAAPAGAGAVSAAVDAGRSVRASTQEARNRLLQTISGKRPVNKT